MTTLDFLSQDREARYLYEMRQKALLDQRSFIDGARREGREEGRKEGRDKGILIGEARSKEEVAKSLLKIGMEVSTIAKVTALSEDEVRKLRS